MAPHIITLSSAEIVDLKDAVPCEPLISASVDTCTAISTRVRLSIFCSMNLDSSLNQTHMQFCRSHLLTLLHHRTLASKCRHLSAVPKKGRLARKPFSRRRFLTVCADIRRRPGGIWCCFSCCHCPVSQVKYPDVAILGCWCVRAMLQANGGHNRYWLWSDVI
jgi:hypothetical protein